MSPARASSCSIRFFSIICSTSLAFSSLIAATLGQGSEKREVVLRENALLNQAVDIDEAGYCLVVPKRYAHRGADTDRNDRILRLESRIAHRAAG